MSDERCQATAKAGKRCTAKARPGRPFCLWHDPEAAEERRRNAQKGGKASSNLARARKRLPADLLTPQEIHAWLGVVFMRVIEGETEPGIGSAAATIARAMLETAKVASFEDELAEMRRELAEISEMRGA